MGHLDRLAATAPALTPRQERALFARMRLPGGIFKTTIARRLTDVDDAVVAALATVQRPAAPLAVLDAGASSGTTSLELAQALGAAGHDVSLTLTDIALTASLVTLSPRYAALLDGNGALLQHFVAGQPVRPWRRRLDYVTQAWVLTAAANRRFARAVADGAIDRARASARPILLVAPQVIAHAGVRCEEADIFAPPPAHHLGAFDIVRAANVLLPEVFDADRIAVGLRHLAARLRGPGALLVLARSPAPGSRGANRATILCLGDDRRLAVLSRIGPGSEIEHLAPDQRRT